MGVFRNENAAARLLGKPSNSENALGACSPEGEFIVHSFGGR